ncbi:hypothetical protein X879_1124 [Burkholderia pseudomallei MSHR3951]|nr:hypothetical protein X944_123 [Burkholderia pseudomallei MSHR3964]KGV85669.1 hypothetical protein X879_1124 [Burkholderia pseudomallei MSHR3951]KGV99784.1 hypothetical protein X892_2453 [Burkholderia pseudomallei MSHR3960]
MGGRHIETCRQFRADGPPREVFSIARPTRELVQNLVFLRVGETFLLSWTNLVACPLLGLMLTLPLFRPRCRDTENTGIFNCLDLFLQVIDLLMQSSSSVAACKLDDCLKHCAIEGRMPDQSIHGIQVIGIDTPDDQTRQYLRRLFGRFTSK